MYSHAACNLCVTPRGLYRTVVLRIHTLFVASSAQVCKVNPRACEMRVHLAFVVLRTTTCNGLMVCDYGSHSTRLTASALLVHRFARLALFPHSYFRQPKQLNDATLLRLQTGCDRCRKTNSSACWTEAA